MFSFHIWDFLMSWYVVFQKELFEKPHAGSPKIELHETYKFHY